MRLQLATLKLAAVLGIILGVTAARRTVHDRRR
jgi:hypothetical protein